MLPKKATLTFDRKFFSFALVGLVGFIVDAGVLTFLNTGFQWGVLPSRLVSFSMATMVTWLLNRACTFSSPKINSVSRTLEYFKYFAVQAVGGSLNLFVFVCLISWIPPLSQLPIIPLAAGSLVAMVCNFLLAQAFVFINVHE